MHCGREASHEALSCGLHSDPVHCPAEAVLDLLFDGALKTQEAAQEVAAATCAEVQWSWGDCVHAPPTAVLFLLAVSSHC